jgi:hypothetical protein
VKYLSAALLIFALSGCAEHHELTACKGPYSAMPPPAPAPVVEAPKAPPPPPVMKQQQAANQGGPK